MTVAFPTKGDKVVHIVIRDFRFDPVIINVMNDEAFSTEANLAFVIVSI